MGLLEVLAGGYVSGIAFKHFVKKAKLPAAATLSFEEICMRAGYSVQNHIVTTEDGYYLRLFRLSGKGQPFTSQKKPVLMTHGLTQSAISFVINQAASPLAFTLADNDYDVWLINTRGSHLSRMHATLNSAEAKYWDFTSQDIASKDLPAAIDFVKAASGKSKISCIGQSQGAISLMGMLMIKPEYNDSLQVLALLNPAGGNISVESMFFRYYLSPVTHALYKYLGWHFVANKPSSFMPKLFVRFPELMAKLHKSRFDVTINGDSNEHLPVYVSQLGSGTSLKNFEYLRQSKQRKDPRLFGFDCGTKTPRCYDYSLIKTKLALFGAKYDTITSPKDFDQLLLQLPKNQIVYMVKDLPLDHFGVLVSKASGYQQAVLQVLREHS